MLQKKIIPFFWNQAAQIWVVLQKLHQSGNLSLILIILNEFCGLSSSFKDRKKITYGMILLI